ncbi:hypothetical protein ACFL6T_03030 [Candidatus Zixiibacteriota bacterium]
MKNMLFQKPYIHVRRITGRKRGGCFTIWLVIPRSTSAATQVQFPQMTDQSYSYFTISGANKAALSYASKLDIPEQRVVLYSSPDVPFSSARYDSVQDIWQCSLCEYYME